MAETVRKSAVVGVNVCLESCQAIATSGTSTERDLAAEAVASFDLARAVAQLTGMPPDSSLAELAEAVRRRL